MCEVSIGPSLVLCNSKLAMILMRWNRGDRDVHLASLAVWNLQAAVDAIDPERHSAAAGAGAGAGAGAVTTARAMRLRDVSGRARLGVELAVVDGKRLGVQVSHYLLVKGGIQGCVLEYFVRSHESSKSPGNRRAPQHSCLG